MITRASAIMWAAAVLAGCAGDPGPAGPAGDRGELGPPGDGTICWDKDNDGECTVATEDSDGSGACDTRDCAGARGDPGAAGPGGPMGPMGPEGPQGMVGPAGPDGAAGLRGFAGGAGPMGQQGLPGPQGPQGPVGPKGSRVALVAEYEFDEVQGATVFADTGGLSNSMNGAVGAGSVIAHSGRSVALTGVEGLVAPDGNQIPDAAQIWPEMWIRATDHNGTYTLIEKVGAYRLRSLFGTLQWTVTTATGPCSVTHTTPLQGGSWSHVSGWYDGLQVVVEIDGSAVTSPCNKGRTATSPGTVMTIGGKLTGVNWTEVFRGNIDEVRVRGVAPYMPGADAVTLKVPVWRWGQFHTYQQSYGWWWGNAAGMNTLGLAPSTWTDGNGQVDQISSNKDWLRSVLVWKGTGGRNAAVVQDNFYYHSSTDSQVTIAMFRIRNTTGNAITWSPQFAITYYVSWDERASLALNGTLQWSSAGQNCNSWACQHSANLSIPPNRTSSVLFAALGGQPSSNRSNILVINNDSAVLPEGLVYVDDFDTMSGDWSE